MIHLGTLIVVKDIGNSKKFYCDLFGLTVMSDFGANISLSGGISLQTADSWKMFINKKDDEIVFGNNASELYFEDDDLDSFVKKLENYGNVRYVHGVVEFPWGQRVIRFYDPDMHIIEVGENLDIVVKRFVDWGMSLEETAARMGVPEVYVSSALARLEGR